MIGSSINKNALLLAAFALVCTGLIAFTYLITEERIRNEIDEALARTINQVVPREQYNNKVSNDCSLWLDPARLGYEAPTRVYRMRDGDSPVAVVVETLAPNGYSGKIHLVVGIYTDGSIAGVRTTQHQETPGLGDKIEIRKSDWMKTFDGLSLANTETDDWAVKKDGGEFDAFTGATITPRAVVQAVRNTLLFHQRENANLYTRPANCQAEPDNQTELAPEEAP